MAKGRIPDQLLQKIRESVNLVDIVQESVVLRKTGANFMGLCPFHADRNPSFSVSEAKQVYICYSCKASGDLFRFVMEKHGIGFMEAVEELAERGHVRLPKEFGGGEEGEDPEVAKRRAEAREKLSLMYRLNRFAAAFYHQELSRQAHVQMYLSARGVDGDLIRRFHLGASPPAWDALASHLVAKQAPLEHAVALGLIRPSTKGGRPGGPGYFDLFRNRAMFPILDMRQRVAGFGGRALQLPPGAPDVGGDSQPKYINSSDSPVFQKGKLAYGLFQAQSQIRETDETVLVEGYFDVIALHAAGFQNAVAACGTALTSDHLGVFRRLGSKVTILFDGDQAGISATERAMLTGLEHGAVLYGAVMPAGLDPDEVLFDQKAGRLKPEGVEQMKAILADAKPILDERIRQEALEAAKGPEARTQALKRIASWLQVFQDPVGREIRIDALVKQLGIGKDLIMKAVSGGGAYAHGHARPEAQVVRNGPASVAAPAGVPAGTVRRAVPSGPFAKRERILLAALVSGDRFRPLVDQAGINMPREMNFLDLFEYVPVRQFLEPLFRQPELWADFRNRPQEFLGGEIDPQVRSVLTEALMLTDGGAESLKERDVREAIRGCGKRAWARFSQRIKAALAEVEAGLGGKPEAKKDAELHDRLLKEYLDVQRKMKEFSTLYDEN